VSQLLQSLLDDYASDGEWHSTGHFTIDDARARDVLTRFQSNNPDLFLLHWVRFATLCGAKRTDIDWHNGDLVLRHNGEWPTFSSWSTLWGHEQPRERALAFCLWNAIHVRFEQARLVAPRGTVVLDAQLQAGEEPSAEPGEFALRLCPSRSKVRQGGPQVSPLGEEQRGLLADRCAFSSVEIHYLGSALEKASLVPCIFHSTFTGCDQKFPLRWPLPSGLGDSLPQTVRSPYFASVYIGVSDGRQGLEVILDGVTYHSSSPMGLPRLYIVLTAPDLRLDLSGERLVHTKTVVSLREWLARDLDGFFRLMIRDLDRAPSGLVPYLEAFISVRLRARDYTGAYQICRWVLRKIGPGPMTLVSERLRDQYLNEWQRASFLYRFALVSLLMRDNNGGRCLGEQAERVWAEAPLQETRWLPKAETPEGQLTREERITFSRLAIEEQTLEDGSERVRQMLDEQAEAFRQQDRWNLVVYCHRWLLEVEQGDRSKGGEPRVGRKGLAIRRALVGIAMIRHLRQKSTPLSQEWYEAQVYLNQALTGWRGQMERQAAVADEDRSTLLEILDAQAHIHLALGQMEGARRMIEVWLEEQSAAPQAYLTQCLEHVQRLRKMLDPSERALAAQLDTRAEAVKKAIKEMRPSTLDLFARFFRSKKDR
jgi:hypothetical protein